MLKEYFSYFLKLILLYFYLTFKCIIVNDLSTSTTAIAPFNYIDKAQYLADNPKVKGQMEIFLEVLLSQTD